MKSDFASLHSFQVNLFAPDSGLRFSARIGIVNLLTVAQVESLCFLAEHLLVGLVGRVGLLCYGREKNIFVVFGHVRVSGPHYVPIILECFL